MSELKSEKSRLSWLRNAYIRFMKEGNNRFAEHYRKLFDEQWAVENPLPLVRNDNDRKR